MIVTEHALFDATGYERREYLARYLREHRIVFWRGRGGRIWTTIEQINRAAEVSEQVFEFEHESKATQGL